jgi:hypothetical protein
LYRIMAWLSLDGYANIDGNKFKNGHRFGSNSTHETHPTYIPWNYSLWQNLCKYCWSFCAELVKICFQFTKNLYFAYFNVTKCLMSNFTKLPYTMKRNYNRNKKWKGYLMFFNVSLYMPCKYTPNSKISFRSFTFLFLILNFEI